MQVKSHLRSLRRRGAHALIALAVMPQVVWAQTGLPTVTPPTAGGGGSGLLGTLQGYAAMAGLLLGLIIATAAFLVVGGGAIGKFNEARKRGEWGDFGVVIVVGVLLIVAVLWMANKAAKIL